MKAFEILKKIIEIIQNNLKVSIYNTFSSKIIQLPIVEKFLTIEIYSGSEDKTLIAITCYSPQATGAQACTELTKKTIEILKSSKIENLNEVLMQNVCFDKTKKAYAQKSKLTFILPKKQYTTVYFGNEKILANEDVCLKFSKNISVYYSQVCGPKIKDLGPTLKKLNGSATIKEDQFKRLCSMVCNTKASLLKWQSESFYALLTNLEKRTKDEVSFSFLEVLQ